MNQQLLANLKLKMRVILGWYLLLPFPLTEIILPPGLGIIHYGKYLVSGNDYNTVQVWEVSTGRLITEYTGHGRNVNSVAFSPDGNTIASGSDDSTVHVWAPPLSSPTYMMLPTAKVLGGKFKIVQVLDETRMGNIYKVEQIGTPYFCAVKELRIHPDIGEENQKNLTEFFNKEVELLSGLKHPQISPFISSFQDHGNCYFVMEFVPGRTLARFLEDIRDPLEEVQVIKWMISICKALTYIHSHTPPILLDDMQLSDIMVTPEGAVRLIDMGTRQRLSRYMPRRKRNRNEAITLENISYRSPEVFGMSREGRLVGRSVRSDIYSLGAIIYHLLTNNEPQPVTTPQVGSILTKNPRLHTIQVDGKTVCPIEQVIIKSMQQDPELRFRNANAMRRALEYCLSK